MAERNGNAGQKKEPNFIVKTGKWLWDNKWTLLSAFAAGVGAGFGGGKLLENHSNKKNHVDDVPPQI